MEEINLKNIELDISARKKHNISFEQIKKAILEDALFPLNLMFVPNKLIGWVTKITNIDNNLFCDIELCDRGKEVIHTLNNKFTLNPSFTLKDGKLELAEIGLFPTNKGGK